MIQHMVNTKYKLSLVWKRLFSQKKKNEFYIEYKLAEIFCLLLVFTKIFLKNICLLYYIKKIFDSSIRRRHILLMYLFREQSVIFIFH